jgi:hypothetical protein
MKRHLWTAMFCTLLSVSVACGDDDGDDDDTDGDQPDASTGDGPDASAGSTHTGQALLLDLEFLNFPFLERGALLEVLFQEKATTIAPSYEESPGSPFACKVTEYTPATFAPIGVGEGTFQYTATGGPDYPPCNFVPGEGYRCVGVVGGGGTIAVDNAKMGTFSLTNEDVTFGEDEIGRLLNVSGAANPSNNGTFPILASPSENTVIFLNQQPGAAAEELGKKSAYQTVAGFGPAGTDQLLPDNSEVTFALTASEDGEAEDFTRTIDIGDAFTLDTESLETIINIPTDGSSFTIGCNGPGGTCNVATASLLQIIATDGDTSTVPPFGLPVPAKKGITMLCVFLAGSVTVNEMASAYIQDVNPTRIRTVFVRANNQLFTQPRVEMLIAAGHAIGGFTDPGNGDSR